MPAEGGSAEMSEQQRTQMRICVHPVAVGVLGVVVHPLSVSRHHLLEKTPDVRQQRGLEFVDEQRTRRVHRPQADQTFADVEATNAFHHPVRQVNQLEALVRLNEESLTMDRQAAGRRRSHILDGLLANGHGRTFAHAVSCRLTLDGNAARAPSVLGQGVRRPGLARDP